MTTPQPRDATNRIELSHVTKLHTPNRDTSEPQKPAPGSTKTQKAASLIQCGGCGNGWTGLSACHCSGCHRTFTGLSAFDIHRVGGQCGDPEVIVGKDGEPRLVRVDRPRWSGWRVPGEMPEDLW